MEKRSAEVPVEAGPPGGVRSATENRLLERSYICQCFKIKPDDLTKIATENNCYDFYSLRSYFDVGSRCTACEVEVLDHLVELQRELKENATATRIPWMRKARADVKQVKTESRFLLRRLLRVPRNFGLFVVRGTGYETELVLSNLTFPEDDKNANGKQVRFDTEVYDSSGQLLAAQKNLTVLADHSRTFNLKMLAPEAPPYFHGMLLLRFYGLRETGSLRPYCRFKYNFQDGIYQGGCHYHDQFLKRRHYQHILVTHPLKESLTCWVAFSNPTQEPYTSNAYLQAGKESLKTEFQLPPYGSLWASIPQLFGSKVTDFQDLKNAFFWLDSDAPLMAWFFWQKEEQNVWSVQHK
jgi:bacterioferritin-associated ferredoxin